MHWFGGLNVANLAHFIGVILGEVRSCSTCCSKAKSSWEANPSGGASSEGNLSKAFPKGRLFTPVGIHTHDMSLTPHNGHGTDGDEEVAEPKVPEGVLRGIEDIAEGRTAGKEDIESVLKF